MVTVDLNADLAEGDELSSTDLAILDSVTSASLACGFHAGNREVMRAAADAALCRGVAIGAHVSYRDRDGFGRRAVAADPEQLVADILEQWSVLHHEVSAVGGTVGYVKPHGALYNRMGSDPLVAASVVDALARLGRPALVAQAESVVVPLAHLAGIRVVCEGFPDRAYLTDGSLAGRDQPGALVDNPETAARRAVEMATRGRIEAVDGTWVSMAVETLCIHGDAPGAGETARRVRSALEQAEVVLSPFTPDTEGPTPDDGRP
jgi:5-oxoprolinase (ATP-hydrolysing) subunit A